MNNNTEVLIRELAEKLGTTFENVYAILVRQAKIEAITELCLVVAVIIFFVKGYRLTDKKTSNVIDNYGTTEWEGWSWLIYWVVFGIFSVAIMSSIHDIVNGFLNPEYVAIKYILSQL